MATLTAKTAMEAFQRRISERHDRYRAVYGDGLKTLLQHHSDGVFIVLPARGPVRWKGSVCDDELGLFAGIRFGVEAAARGLMLECVEDLREHVRWSDASIGLERCTPGEPSYQYQVSEGSTVAFAILPATLIYAVEV